MARFRNNQHQSVVTRLYERGGLMIERLQRFDQTALMAELIEWRTWSFRITLGGTRYVSYEQQTYTLSPNTIVWHAPLKQPLRLRWVPGTGSDVVVVSFTSQRWRDLLEQYPALAQRAQALLAADQTPLAQQSAPPQLLHVLRQVIALGASQRPGALALDNHCALLLNLLAELRFDVPAPCQEHERRRVETAQAWMIDQMAKRPSLGEIAEALCVSPRQLQRDFLACAGMTPMRYLALMRLSEANFLLAETSLPIAEIATLLGYTSPAHFSAAFRQLYQCSPRQVREIFLY